MIGTLVNVGAIVGGSLVGMLIGEKLPDKMRNKDKGVPEYSPLTLASRRYPWGVGPRERIAGNARRAVHRR